MSGPSKIEWTERTWNPIVGCSIVSPGCTNCYAMQMAARIQKMNRTGGSGSDYVNHYDGTTRGVNGHSVWTGKLAKAPPKIFFAPLSRNIPTTWFVNSMGDLFHEAVPDDWILEALDVILRTSFDGGGNCGKIGRGFGQHTYQLLTKRAARMADFMRRLRFESIRGLYLADDDRRPVVLKNLWLGVSTERQQEADERIPMLLQTPAALRFISAEPLLGPLEIEKYLWGEWKDSRSQPVLRNSVQSRRVPSLDWVIVGGESGRGARPMSIQWARELRDQCAAADVPFFFKQFGEWRPAGVHPSGTPGHFAFGDYEHDRSTMILVENYPRQFTKFGARTVMERVGKARAGRLLDGVEHNGFPTSGDNHGV